MAIRDKLRAAWRFIRACVEVESPPMGVGIISETVMESIKAKREARNALLQQAEKATRQQREIDEALPRAVDGSSRYRASKATAAQDQTGQASP